MAEEPAGNKTDGQYPRKSINESSESARIFFRVNYLKE